MGILEIHFHDSEFSWSVNPGTDDDRSLSLGSGSRSGSATTDDGSGRPSVAPKLRSLAIMVLIVGAGIAYNRIQGRRAREAVEGEESGGGRLSRIRSR